MWRRLGQPTLPAVRAGGGGGIRTHGGVAPTAVFKTAALNHSATPPSVGVRGTRFYGRRFTSSVIFKRRRRCWRSSSAVRFSGTVTSLTKPSVERRSVWGGAVTVEVPVDGAPRSGRELRIPSGRGISIDVIGTSPGSSPKGCWLPGSGGTSGRGPGVAK